MRPRRNSIRRKARQVYREIIQEHETQKRFIARAAEATLSHKEASQILKPC
jgi:RNase P protein component